VGAPDGIAARPGGAVLRLSAPGPNNSGCCLASRLPSIPKRALLASFRTRGSAIRNLTGSRDPAWVHASGGCGAWHRSVWHPKPHQDRAGSAMLGPCSDAKPGYCINSRRQIALLPGIVAFPGRVLDFSILAWSEPCSRLKSQRYTPRKHYCPGACIRECMQWLH